MNNVSMKAQEEVEETIIMGLVKAMLTPVGRLDN